ncbi:MAG TPA: gamma-glutamyl-gamma-aminobutyrate hydrolase family protein [Roseiflexaceae bacterium]|nr:gamma-glutamyl-gamma-aminobutyrate hydrolase family protein [Roseiflexaceae bacterium]
MTNEAEARPIIGLIASRYPRPGRGTILSGIGEQYLLAIEGGGGIPLLIHLTRDEAVLQAHYRRCDGLLFAGGDDVDPAHFGQARHPKLGAIEELRDEVELALARQAIEDGKPVLGICRGIQLLNVAMGGTLYQDIPSELPDALDHYASSKLPGRAHMAHPITLAPESWLAARLETTELPGNTFHHQALRDIAPGLRVTGRAPDGVVEVVEGAGRSFVVGVQCHPEDLWEQADTRWARLFAGFVEAARQYALAAV